MQVELFYVVKQGTTGLVYAAGPYGNWNQAYEISMEMARFGEHHQVLRSYVEMAY